MSVHKIRATHQSLTSLLYHLGRQQPSKSNPRYYFQVRYSLVVLGHTLAFAKHYIKKYFLLHLMLFDILVKNQSLLDRRHIFISICFSLHLLCLISNQTQKNTARCHHSTPTSCGHRFMTTHSFATAYRFTTVQHRNMAGFDENIGLVGFGFIFTPLLVQSLFDRRISW